MGAAAGTAVRETAPSLPGAPCTNMLLLLFIVMGPRTRTGDGDPTSRADMSTCPRHAVCRDPTRCIHTGAGDPEVRAPGGGRKELAGQGRG